jgi:hypothetical protein
MTNEDIKAIPNFYPLQKPEILAMKKLGIINNAKLVYFALQIERKNCIGKTTADILKMIAAEWKISTSSFYKAIAQLEKSGQLPDWINYTPKEVNSIESKVRNNLQSQLGGLIEVTTPSGRIDLLTETEIIEVKNIKDWKAALDQILVYSAFYPNHKKRIHLFGENIDNLADLELSCLPFDVAVTGELI